jgi:hypothetical protein
MGVDDLRISLKRTQVGLAEHLLDQPHISPRDLQQGRAAVWRATCGEPDRGKAVPGWPREGTVARASWQGGRPAGSSLALLQVRLDREELENFIRETR